jgi:hypothetical protein
VLAVLVCAECHAEEYSGDDTWLRGIHNQGTRTIRAELFGSGTKCPGASVMLSIIGAE